ncbi:hypothetical protein M758_1G102800 [Ceratodon purpureus]|nr:hypothetical protein M758_1G102800 [Ceratodon purpureus]
MPRKKQKVDEPEGQQTGDNVKIATQQRTSRRVTRSTAHVPAPLPEVAAKKQSTASYNAAPNHRDEEGGKARRAMGTSLTTNVLALIDTAGVKKTSYVDTDQLIFLDTIRVLSVVPDVAVLPPKELYERIFSGIQETKSLQVTVASFKLLHDLDLRHPQVSLKNNGTGEKTVYEFVDNKEQVWSPFESTQKSEESAKVTKDLYLLLGNIADDLEGKETLKKRGASDFAVRNDDPQNRLVQFLVLRWLVSLLCSDFQVRQQAFQDNPEKLDLLQESLIIRFMMKQDNSTIKKLLENLLRIIAKPGELDDLKGGGNSKELKAELVKNEPESCDSEITATASGATSVGSSPAFFVTETDFAHLAATLLSMILELEDIKALSDNKFGVSRNAISIGSLVETLMGVLQYGKASLCPLLLALKNPQLKFKLILQCFVTHAPGRTKEELREISTAKNLFDCVSNVKALHKSFYPHELQVLLASAFQAFLETHTGDDASLREVCQSFQAAFKHLDDKMEYKEMHHTARCALATAHALINS